MKSNIQISCNRYKYCCVVFVLLLKMIFNRNCMKKKIIFLIFSLFNILLPIMAQDSISNRGILFEDISFKEALAKAKAEGKKVFIDCYTQTCGPCKYMMKNIFPLQECGDYFNPKFVSLTRDMDVGEGPELGKKYKVGIYPTFLIINPDGTLFCKEMGAVRLNSNITFVEKIENAIQRATEINELEKKYNSGEKNTVLVRKLVDLLKVSDFQKADTLLNQYLSSLSIEELCKDDTWNMFSSEINSPDSPVFRKLLANRAHFEKLLGKDRVEGKIISTYQNEFNMCKMLDMHFDQRIADLKDLEKNGYSQALALRESMTLRWIINEKQVNRIGEILSILQKLKTLPSDAERMAVIKELNSFERVASIAQRNKACTELRNIQKLMDEKSARAIERFITRISPKK